MRDDGLFARGGRVTPRGMLLAPAIENLLERWTPIAAGETDNNGRTNCITEWGATWNVARRRLVDLVVTHILNRSSPESTDIWPESGARAPCKKSE